MASRRQVREISALLRSCGVLLRLLAVSIFLVTAAFAAEKPPVIADRLAPFATLSHITIGVEFDLPYLAREIERDVPRRLASFDERISCVHRRVLFLHVNANCDIRGFVERTGPITLRGEGPRIIGSTPIYGAVEGQGANRITAHIKGETEARMVVEGEARPELRRDWTVDLNFSDGFHWTERPYLHVLGHEIALARFVEPRIRAQLQRVRARALAAVRKLDLRGKAAVAWQEAFAPIKLADQPEVWLQLKPQAAAFGGISSTAHVLRGTLEIAGTAETHVGAAPPPVAPSGLPPLGSAVTAPGTFDVILPVGIDYAVMKQAIRDLATRIAPEAAARLRDIDVYPSSGKLVIGLKIAPRAGTDPNAGRWIYLAAKPQIDADSKSLHLAGLAAIESASDTDETLDGTVVDKLKEQLSISYAAAYQKLLAAANKALTRPLAKGFRMEGHLESATPDQIQLLADRLNIGLRLRGELKILYGL